MIRSVIQFGLLLFLLFAGLGAMHIPLYTTLSLSNARGGLGFSPLHVTVVASLVAVAAVLSFSLVRWLELFPLRRQNVLAILSAASSLWAACFALAVECRAALIDMTAVSLVHAESSSLLTVALVGGVLALFSLCTATSTAVGYALVLFHLRSRESLFAGLRVAGTVGYLCAGLVIGLLLDSTSAQPYWLASGVYLALACFCLAGLSDTPAFDTYRSHQPPSDPLLWEIGKQCGAGVFILALLCAAVARFYEVYANPFLTATPDLSYPSAVQMLALSLEIVLLICMPLLLRSVSHARFLVLGPAGWSLLYFCFVLGVSVGSPWLIMLGLPFQGFNCAFGTAASLFINSKVSVRRRESAQSLLMAAQGAGTLAGTVVVGVIASACSRDGASDWRMFWLLAFCMSVAAAGFAIVSVSTIIGGHATQASSTEAIPDSTARPSPGHAVPVK